MTTTRKQPLHDTVKFIGGVALTWGIIFGAAVLEKIVQ